MTKPELEDLRQAIMLAMHRSTYDHRPLMPMKVQELFPHMMEVEQLLYSRFKLAVAQVLQPKTIYEVGIGWGVSATAFMHGWPTTKFFGIDNAEMGLEPEEVLPVAGGWHIVDSKKTPFIHPYGPIDLLHIDGGHGIENKASDIRKAIEARPEWILVDDIHNVMVAAGTFAGLWQAASDQISMLMFENSHTGNLLIHAKRLEPVYRIFPQL